MASWIIEGTAHRSPVRMYPVRHLLVDNGGEWTLWCSGGKGRPDCNPHSKKFCRECVSLANEAIEDDTLAPDDVNGWPVLQGV
jgi:hypothetical protein